MTGPLGTDQTRFAKQRFLAPELGGNGFEGPQFRRAGTEKNIHEHDEQFAIYAVDLRYLASSTWLDG
jgi:hypothetical protein